MRTREDESGETYHKLKAALAAVRKASPGIRYVYTMRKTKKPNTWQFVVDAEEDPENVSHVGDEYDVSEYPEMQRAFAEPAADLKPAQDQWGTWLSGYAPIRDPSGRVEAIVGLDMSIERVRCEEALLRAAALKNVLVAIVLAIALSLLVTKALLKAVRIFTRAAQRVRSGDLDFQIPWPNSDEIGRFAEAFNHMIAGLKESRERLMEQSTRDFLTGLFNHMHFQEQLASEIERARRYERKLCLLVIDVDRFKPINDALGHPIGDSVLRQLGRLLRDSVRSMDLAARYGGDEFAVILAEADLASGQDVAERIREEVEKHPFRAVTLDQIIADESAHENESLVNITVTVGLAGYPDHHDTRDGLIMAADIALSRGKHIARNSVCTYDPSIAVAAHVDLHDLYQALHDPTVAAIQSLAAAVDAKDRYTHGHSERVTQYALQLAEALGANPEMMDAVKVAGLLHDIGKIGVPDSILNKPGSLTREERESIMEHPSVGGNILRRAPQLDLIVPAVLFHHERWDGGGYPDGLSGEAIPLMARILAIADAFDAMTSDRPYRKAMTLEGALTELRANAGKQFDPALVEAFVERANAQLQEQAA